MPAPSDGFATGSAAEARAGRRRGATFAVRAKEKDGCRRRDAFSFADAGGRCYSRWEMLIFGDPLGLMSVAVGVPVLVALAVVFVVFLDGVGETLTSGRPACRRLLRRAALPALPVRAVV